MWLQFAALAAAIGLFASYRLLYKADDCCSWGQGGKPKVNGLAVLGLGFYLGILALLSLTALGVSLLPLLVYLSIAAFCFSLVLTLAQAIEWRWCRWCVTSALASAGLLAAVFSALAQS